MPASPPPPATLDTTPLCELLAHARQRRLSGSLKLRSLSSAQHVVVLHEGVITKVGSSGAEHPERRLGTLLLRSGVIGREQLASALRDARRRGSCLGRSLVEAGSATAEDLEVALSAQRRQRLRELCKLPRNYRFGFIRGEDELSACPPFASNIVRDLWLCVRTEAPLQRVAALRSTLGTRHLSLCETEAIAAWGFSPEELACLEPLRAGCRLADLEQRARARSASLEQIYLCVYALVLARALVVRDPSTQASPSMHSSEKPASRGPRFQTPSPGAPNPPDDSPHPASFPPSITGRAHTTPVETARTDTPEACCQRALQAIRHRRLDAALEIVVEARKRFSQDAVLRGCHAWLRTCLAPAPSRDATAEESLFELNLCIHKCPNDLSLRRYRADLLRRMGRTEEAVIDLTLIARTDPEDLDARRELRLYKLRRNKSMRPRSSWSRLVLWR